MNYEFTAGSERVMSSLYDFENDSYINAKTYTDCMKAPYISIVSYMKGAAEAGGLELDPETLERWKRVCSAMYFIDEFLDTAPDRKAACHQFENGLRSSLTHDTPELLATTSPATHEQLVPIIILLKNSMQTLPEARVASLIEAACDINTIALKKITIDDTQHYIELLHHEATQTSNLLTQSVSDAVHRQPDFNQFASWCQQTMTMAILADSAVDLRQDYREEVVAVSPTAIHIARLAIGALTPAMRLAVRHPKSTAGSLRERLRFAHILPQQPPA